MRPLLVIASVLAAAVVGLTIALTVVLARGDDSQRPVASYQMPMMGNQIWMNNLNQMRQMVGDDDYTRMMQHMQAHRLGTPAVEDDPNLDAVMHRMIDRYMAGWSQKQWDDFLTPVP